MLVNLQTVVKKQLKAPGKTYEECIEFLEEKTKEEFYLSSSQEKSTTAIFMSKII